MYKIDILVLGVPSGSSHIHFTWKFFFQPFQHYAWIFDRIYRLDTAANIKCLQNRKIPTLHVDISAYNGMPTKIFWLFHFFSDINRLTQNKQNPRGPIQKVIDFIQNSRISIIIYYSKLLFLPLQESVFCMKILHGFLSFFFTIKFFCFILFLVLNRNHLQSLEAGNKMFNAVNSLQHQSTCLLTDWNLIVETDFFHRASRSVFPMLRRQHIV